MNLGSKSLRILLCIAVVGGAYVSRPSTMRRVVFFLAVLAGTIIVNLALSLGQEIARRRSVNAPSSLGAVAPEQSGTANPPARKPWWIICLGFVGSTGLGVTKAHETGIWLFIPVGILVGFSFGYYMLTHSGRRRTREL